LVKQKAGRFHFFFTDRFCETSVVNDELNNWDGVHVIFERVSDDAVTMTTVQSNFSEFGRTSAATCSIPITNGTFRFGLVQNDGTNNRLSARYYDPDMTVHVCALRGEIMRGGYFGFIGEGVSDDIVEQELFEFTVSGIPEKVATESIISDNIRSRKLFKSMTGNFVSKRSYHFAGGITPREKLDADGPMSKANTRLIFAILSEITDRAKLGLDFQNLNILIELAGVAQFPRISGALENRKSMVIAVARDIDDLLDDLSRELAWLKTRVWTEMNSTGDANFAELVTHLMQIAASGEKLAFFSQSEEHVRRPVDLAMVGVCLIEFIAYVTFIFIRRRQTRGFKVD
jgi:hypothetical protein